MAESTGAGGVSASPATALVCGTAAGLSDDFQRARSLRPDALVIAVNNTVRLMPADWLFSLHPEKLVGWADLHERCWGTRPVTYGARPRPGCVVDHWRPEARGGGSSGWSAAKLALIEGFAEVILCGVPLDAVAYEKRGPARAFNRRDILERYRNGLLADAAWHEGVRSMSGWTREVLGFPE